jgi:tetratricopeptide (TPR) repeat protein
MTGVDRPTRARSGGPWFTRPVSWILAAGVTLGSVAVPAAQQPPAPSPRPAAGAATPAPQPPTPDPPPAAPAKSPIDAAERALIEGRFADVEALAAEPGAPESRRIVLARTDAARGRLQAARERLEAEVAKAPTGDAALELGYVLRDLGRRDDAIKLWTAIVADRADERTPLSIYREGRALSALDQPRRASAAFQEAAADAQGDPRIPTAWAELFLEKHNAKEAAETFETALQADPRWIPALVGYASAMADDDPAAARASLEKALAIDPASVAANLWLAEQALDGRRLTDAGAELAKVLAVNPDQVEALSLQAAIAAIEDRNAEADQLAQRVLALRPGSGAVYRIIGAQLAGHYRFEEAVAQGRKAMAIEPADPRTQAALGMHLLRTGDETAARTALDTAFRKDPFDVVTYNSLSMLDTLDRFQTITTEDGLILKIHPEEVALMREPVEQLARKALADLGKRYDVTPKGPVLIEMFPRHDDFAVRTLGLPGMVGALGACFGRVVTLDSPRARPPGTFNWAATLWHELAHVVTLQLSNQRVPRWLTEGASVFEERRADASWGREGELDFLRAYAAGKAIPLASLNSAFTDGRTIGLAYHQSSLLVEHLVERFGDAGLRKLLAGYGRGLAQDGAISDAFGVDLANLQTSFDAFLDGRFKGPKAALAPIDAELPEVGGDDPKAIAALIGIADTHAGQYDIQLAVGRALIARGGKDQARKVLERAVPLVPQTMGDESALTLLAGLAQERGDVDTALTQLDAVVKESHTAIESARKLMTLGRQANQLARARVGAERVLTLDPFDGAAHAEVGRAALAAGDIPAAITALERGLTLRPADIVTQHTDLAEAYLRAGRPDDARKQAILALEQAPRFERAQELLLQIVDGR